MSPIIVGKIAASGASGLGKTSHVTPANKPPHKRQINARTNIFQNGVGLIFLLVLSEFRW